MKRRLFKLGFFLPYFNDLIHIPAINLHWLIISLTIFYERLFPYSYFLSSFRKIRYYGSCGGWHYFIHFTILFIIGTSVIIIISSFIHFYFF